MTQPGLFADLPASPKRHHSPPKTSVLAYERCGADGRMAKVLKWLRRSDYEYGGPPPVTSAELAHDVHRRNHGWAGHFINNPPMELILYVRSGLSDAKRKGLVVNGEKRACRVSGKVALTWRVSQR